jgi:hypothetical protein
LRHQDVLTVREGDVGVVARPANFKMGSTKGENLEGRQERLALARNACSLKQARKVWVTDYIFRDRIAPIRVGTNAVIAERMIGNALNLEFEIALLFVEETTTICH